MGVFNDKMKKVVEQQQREVEKAVIKCGKYRLRTEYSFLSLPEDKWFRMTEAQRVQHLKKFNMCLVRESRQLYGESISNETEQSLQCHDITVGQFQLGQNNSLSVSYEDAIVATRLPKEVVEGVWAKAAMLTSESNAITFAPGCGNQDRMVKSTSQASPHLVTVSKNCQYKCDDNCPQHKSLALCSHTVAAAESNGDLQQFLKWYSKSRGKQPLNMTPLTLQGMPAGAGRKGGRAPRKRSRTTLIPTDENRVPLTPSTKSTNGSVDSSPDKTGLQDSSACVNTSESLSTNTSVSNSSSLSIPPVCTPLPATYNRQSLLPPSLPLFCQPSTLSQAVPHFTQYQRSPPPPQSQPVFSSPVSATSPLPSYHQEFVLCFKSGNIRVCAGCHSNYSG